MNDYEKAVRIYAAVLVEVNGYSKQEVAANNYQLVKEDDSSELFRNIMEIIKTSSSNQQFLPQVGEHLICKKDHSTTLTFRKSYKVLERTGDEIMIKDDYGVLMGIRLSELDNYFIKTN